MRLYVACHKLIKVFSFCIKSSIEMRGKMNYNLAIFDLDGTILNTIEDGLFQGHVLYVHMLKEL